MSYSGKGNRMSLSTAKPWADNWSGQDPKRYLKLGAHPQLTKFGRRKIVELYFEQNLSPLRIAVRMGIPNKFVQLTLKHLAGRPVDFVWDDYYSGGLGG